MGVGVGPREGLWGVLFFWQARVLPLAMLTRTSRRHNKWVHHNTIPYELMRFFKTSNKNKLNSLQRDQKVGPQSFIPLRCGVLTPPCPLRAEGPRRVQDAPRRNQGKFLRLLPKLHLQDGGMLAVCPLQDQG